jgi:predicted dinucleotide-binding enzyme
VEVTQNQEKNRVMKIAILGTGMVGSTIATKLVNIGHQIMMGSRTANSDAARQWLRSIDGRAQIGTFADASAFGEIIFDCTNGANALAALRTAGEENLHGKILVQVGNPLDFSQGMPPTLTVCNTDSLGEQVQREFPDVRVVKALNTVNCDIMIAPSRVPGDHDLFICGNEKPNAKSPSGSAIGSAGRPTTLLTLATSPTRVARRCFWHCGCACGAYWERRTSTSMSFEASETGVHGCAPASSGTDCMEVGIQQRHHQSGDRSSCRRINLRSRYRGRAG